MLTILFAGQGVAQIRTAEDWEAHYLNLLKTGDPIVNHAIANENGEYAWNGHYWIRAFITMADLTSDKIYVERALQLAEKMIDRRDDRRTISVNAERYVAAPIPFLKNSPQILAPGWRRWDNFFKGWRIFLIEDAQIIQAMARLVRLIKNKSRFREYLPAANQLFSEAHKTARMHGSSFRYRRFARIPGSFYYPDTSGLILFSGTVEYNMNASMGTALLILQEVQPDSAFRHRAEAILQYFLEFMQVESDMTINWPYRPQNPGYGVTKSGVEDFNHAHLVLGFLLECRRQNLNIPPQIFSYLTNSVIKRIYLGDGELAWAIDGSEKSEFKNYWPIAFDWIELSQFDPQILKIAREVYQRHYPRPGWGREFLGWAEILRWELKLKGGKN